MKYIRIVLIFFILGDLHALENNQSDPLKSYINIYSRILNTTSTDHKIDLIEELSSGLMHDSQAVKQQTYRWLYSLDTSLLNSEKIRQNVDNYFVENNIHNSTSVVFKNRLNLISEDDLLSLASSDLLEPDVGRWYGTEAWGAVLALASLGKDKFAFRAIKRVEAERDIILKATVLINNLAQTKNPIVISYLIKNYLESDQRLPAHAKGRVGDPIAKSTAYQLGKALSNFPIKRDYYSDYTDQDIQECRLWGKNYIDNSPRTLIAAKSNKIAITEGDNSLSSQVTKEDSQNTNLITVLVNSTAQNRWFWFGLFCLLLFVIGILLRITRR